MICSYIMHAHVVIYQLEMSLEEHVFRKNQMWSPDFYKQNQEINYLPYSPIEPPA